MRTQLATTDIRREVIGFGEQADKLHASDPIAGIRTTRTHWRCPDRAQDGRDQLVITGRKLGDYEESGNGDQRTDDVRLQHRD